MLKRTIITAIAAFIIAFVLSDRTDAARQQTQATTHRVIFYEPGTGLNGGVPNTVRLNLPDAALQDLEVDMRDQVAWFSYGTVSINLYTTPVIDGATVAPDATDGMEGG